MSEVWDAHYKRVQDLINANPVARYRPPPAPESSSAVSMQDLLKQMGILPESWQGGGNQASDGAQAANNTTTGGGFPNVATLADRFDISPTAARAGLTAVGLLSGPVGMGLSAANMLGNVANTSSNYGMLSGLGVNPSVSSVLGGLLGFNGLAGTPTAALNAAMANQYSGFSNLSPEQTPGDVTGTGFAASAQEIAAAMDAANAAAAEQGGRGSNPSGGMGDRGDISAESLYQKGGYTGAGKDGVVQPWKRAGIVHEGELVIPHHMVRQIAARGLLG